MACTASEVDRARPLDNAGEARSDRPHRGTRRARRLYCRSSRVRNRRSIWRDARDDAGARRGGDVPRALLDGLQSTTHAPVAFGSAPASYVKTTLLALCELARARPARRATRGGALVADAETDALIAAAGVRPPDDRVARSVEARLRQPVLVAGDHVARHSAQVDGVGPRGHGDPLQRGGCGIGAHEMDGRTGASRQLEGVLHGLLRRRAIRRSLRRSRSCAEPTPAGASEMESKRDARCAQIDEAAVTSGGTRTS